MIDQRFLDDLAQDLRLPEEAPTPEVQLASANTGVTTDVGPYVGYRLNMPKGLTTPEQQAKQSVLIADTLAGTGKGIAQGWVGLPGDLESIGRMALNYLGYQVDENTALPTSEDIGKRLESLLGPVVPQGQTTSVPTAERVRAAEGGELGGEILAPGGQLKLAGKVAKPVMKATGEIIKAGKDLPVGMSIKAVDESLDPLGFYSAASKAVDGIAQDKGTGAQFLAQIEKTPGVKKEELLWTGLDDFLKGKKSVTKAEVQEYLNANRVEVKEVNLGEAIQYNSSNYDQLPSDIKGLIDDADNKVIDLDTLNSKARDMGYKMNYDFGGDLESITKLSDNIAGETKFSKYTLPGGENYREVLLTLPTNKARADNVDDAFNMWMADAKAGKRGQYTAEELASITKDDVLDILKEDYLTPSTKGEFRSQHFDQPNVLAHMRLNDRVDVDGKKVLFVEEVQSDWHQAGRKKGYQGDINEAAKEYTSILKVWGNKPAAEMPADVKARLDELRPIVSQNAREAVPDAPFKTSWHELALKRAIQLAAEGGYDRIAFTTGKTQAERYDLSKQVSSVSYKDGMLQAYNSDGALVINKKVEPSNLDEYVGKELGKTMAENAQKSADARIAYREAIKRDAPEKELEQLQDAINQSKTEYTGVDLQIGGEGMKGFYDTILPKYLDKYGKKWDAKTGMTNLSKNWQGEDLFDYLESKGMTMKQYDSLSKAEQNKLLKDAGTSVHYMDITPKMKESVLTKGQPLFQMAPAIPAGAAATQMQEENK